MKELFKKVALNWIVPIFLFIVLSSLYFISKFEGKELSQHDVGTYKGMSKEIRDYKEESGENTLWTNSMFSGMPSYLINTPYVKTFLIKIHSFFTNYKHRPINHLVFYMIGFYIFLMILGVNRWLSVVGAITYGFSSYFLIIIAAGHITKIIALGYMPPIIGSVLLAKNNKAIYGAILLSIFLSFQIVTNHIQIVYYTFLILLIYGLFWVYDAAKEKQLLLFTKQISILLIGVVLAIGVNSTNLYLTYDYGKYSIRGASELTSNEKNQTSGLDKDYATAWSYGKMETFNLLIPNLYGGASASDIGTDSELYKELKKYGAPNAKQIVQNARTYWGPQPMTSGPVYIGAIVIFLFFLGAFLVKGQIKKWLITATVFSILLAWGNNFMWLTNLFLDYFPGYNKFRTVSMILVIAQFTIPTLGILAINKIIKEEVSKQEFLNAFKWSGIIVGGILLFFLVFGKGIFNFASPIDKQMFGTYDNLIQAIQNDRASMMISDTFRSMVFIALAAGALWFYFNKKLKKFHFIGILGILILIDLWAVDKRYLNSDDFVSKKKAEEPYQPTQADLQILQDKDPHFRVFNVSVSTFNDASTSYFHKSIGGYHGAKMRRYQELIDHQISKNNMAVLNMLNTKYFIVPDKTAGSVPQLNPNALGNAWFVNDYKLVENADEEIAALTGFVPSETAIIDKRFKNEISGLNIKNDSLATINLLEYKPNYLKYKSNNSSESLAVFSEIYYPKGWIAKVNGEEVSHFRVNYVLRAMKLPAGENIVEFSFEPKAYEIGKKISIASSLLLILFAIGILVQETRLYLAKRKEE